MKPYARLVPRARDPLTEGVACYQRRATEARARRIGLAVGLQYVILAVAAGKAFGSAVYFLRGFG